MRDINQLIQTNGGYDGALAVIGGIDVLQEATERGMYGLDNPGFCVACGEEREGCEPDAVGYECEACGLNAVCGAESLFMLLV